MTARRGLTLIFVACVACSGADGETLVATPAPPDASRLDGVRPADVLASPFCATPQPGTGLLRRLSHVEYRHTLTDLIGDEGAVDLAMRDFPSETESLGFRNNAETLVVNPLMAGRYLQAAKDLAPAVTRTVTNDVCFTLGTSDCGKAAVARMAERLFRRTLAAAELAPYNQSYDDAVAHGSSRDEALGWVAAGLLQSPHFLYRIEAANVASTAVRVAGFEMASRLSYLLWQSMPDEALFEAARKGRLHDDRQIEEQARRMLRDPRAYRVYEFFEQWLDLDRLATMERDETAYGGVSPRLGRLLQAETRAFVQHLLASPSGNLALLLGAPYTFANAELAAHYGLDGVTGTTFVRVVAPGRAGILTQGMLIAHDRPARTSIVRRGLKLRTDLLCQLVPAPPDTVDLTLSGLGPALTQRQRLEQHSHDPACAGCHQLMDPLGAVFETFDAVGRPRSVDEHGVKVALGGTVASTRDLDGPVATVHELAARLAASDEVRECFVVQAFRFFFGRDPTAQDLCTQAQMMKRLQEHDGNLAEFVLGLTATDAFRYKPAAGAEGGLP